MGVTPKTKRQVITTLETKIGTFEYYPNMVVSVIKEGVHVTFETAVEPLQTSAQVFGCHENFVCISHRLHSYSIDPKGSCEAASMFPNFKALAIVATSRQRRMLANLERLFMKKHPVYVFDSLELAFEWADGFLASQPKNPV